MKICFNPVMPEPWNNCHKKTQLLTSYWTVWYIWILICVDVLTSGTLCNLLLKNLLCNLCIFFRGKKTCWCVKTHVSHMIQMVIDKVQFRLHVNDLCMIKCLWLSWKLCVWLQVSSLSVYTVTGQTAPFMHGVGVLHCPRDWTPCGLGLVANHWA